MESSSSRANAQKQSQEEIKRQIALLQAKLLPEAQAEAEVSVRKPRSPKRPRDSGVALAPATPSPKKKRRLEVIPTANPIPRPVFHTAGHNGGKAPGKAKAPEKTFIKPAPSKLLSGLSNLKMKTDSDELKEETVRSTAFSAEPAPISAAKRDDRLALIEDFEPGPYEHTAPPSDPEFKKLEPHSGIALVSRTIPHEDICDFLVGRYYLSPSRLYSCIRLLPNKVGYDVPTPGDWVTIAVVAERGPIKLTRAPVAIEKEEGDDELKKQAWKNRGRPTAGGGEAGAKSSGKKFVNLKLIDFGARSGSESASANGGKSVIRGDAFLTLLLFEADGFDLIQKEDGKKPEKVYRGGSRGAFEHMTDVREGDVIALLNPKVLKPYQRSNDNPHPVDNVLAVTPESASSIMVIGRSRDLGMCVVRKQDGKVCGSWCDKRVSEVCDYHVQHAVQRRRAARPEFSASTSGMSTSATHRRKDYDPARQWGLKPDDSASSRSSTYVVSGHVVGGSNADPRTMYVGESIGREGQAKARRKLDVNADKHLKALLEKDKEGMKPVLAAQRAALDKLERKSKGAKDKGKRKRTSEEDDAVEQGEKRVVSKSAYSAEAVKLLGFDPSLKAGQRRVENSDAQSKLEALEAVLHSRKEVNLAPRPGPKIRSGVFAPAATVTNTPLAVEKKEVNLDSDDDLPERLAPEASTEEKMVDLDDF